MQINMMVIETIGVAVVLGLIVLLVKRVYGPPVSEYGRLLDAMPRQNRTDEAERRVKQRVEAAKRRLQQLERALSLSKHRPHRRRLKRRITTLKLLLVKYRLRSYSSEKR